MGLWITIQDNNKENVFKGSYGEFNLLRRAICEACEGSWPPHAQRFRLTTKLSEEDTSGLEKEMWYWGDSFSKETNPGIHDLLCHSDYEGRISWEIAGSLAEELCSLKKKEEVLQRDRISDGIDGLISGCRKAFLLEKDLLFY